MNRRLTVPALLAGALLAGCSSAAGASRPSVATTTPAPQATAVAPATSPATPPVPAPPKPRLDVVKVRVDYVFPNSGTYGIGMPIEVVFTKDVPKRYRDDVEAAVTAKASRPVAAAWSWTADDTMTLRPETFWPAGTTVRVHADLSDTPDIPVARNKVLRLNGGTDTKVKFSRAQVIAVNAKTDYATVTRNGKKVRTMPVSLGKPGWETRSGTKVIMERYRVKQMTSRALGSPDYFDLQVPYALRVTSSGEFLHAAPWATSRLGRYNGSHGCTNLSMADAQWLFENALMGDPVITTGTGKKTEPWNGYGGMWNTRWKRWLTASATGVHEIGPTPTRPATPAVPTETPDGGLIPPGD